MNERRRLDELLDALNAQNLHRVLVMAKVLEQMQTETQQNPRKPKHNPT